MSPFFLDDWLDEYYEQIIWSLQEERTRINDNTNFAKHLSDYSKRLLCEMPLSMALSHLTIPNDYLIYPTVVTSKNSNFMHPQMIAMNPNNKILDLCAPFFHMPFEEGLTPGKRLSHFYNLDQSMFIRYNELHILHATKHRLEQKFELKYNFLSTPNQ